MAKRTVVKPVADGQKYILLENLVNVTVKLPDSGTCMDKFCSKEPYAVHSGRGQVGFDGQHLIVLYFQ